MGISVINVRDYKKGIEEAARYIHSKWGNPQNFNFYYDSICHAPSDPKKMPQFFLLLEDQAKEEKIIGCYGLIMNDFISRQDLYPWVCSLYVEESERGKAYGMMLIEHASKEVFKVGFPYAYLTTDLDGYYEKLGWERIEDAFESCGKSAKVYSKRNPEK